jgi:hypothetical protein
MADKLSLRAKKQASFSAVLFTIAIQTDINTATNSNQLFW